MNGETPLGVGKVGQRREILPVVGVHQIGVAVAEGAPGHVLAGKAHAVSLVYQAAIGQ